MNNLDELLKDISETLIKWGEAIGEIRQQIKTVPELKKEIEKLKDDNQRLLKRLKKQE